MPKIHFVKVPLSCDLLVVLDIVIFLCHGLALGLYQVIVINCKVN